MGIEDRVNALFASSFPVFFSWDQVDGVVWARNVVFLIVVVVVTIPHFGCDPPFQTYLSGGKKYEEILISQLTRIREGNFLQTF